MDVMRRNYMVVMAGIVSIFGVNVSMAAEQVVPAIHIKHTIDNASLREMIQARRNLCIQEKDVLLNVKKSGSAAWPAMIAAMKKKKPNYDVDAKTAAEPDWTKVAVDSEEEYFYGEMYASRKEKTKYKMSEDGKCEVIETRLKSENLDDGKFRYFVDLTRGKATKYMSKAASQKQSDEILQREFGKNPQVSEAMQSAFAKADISALNDAVKEAGSEKVTDNQTCNYKILANDAKTRLCYWSVMSYYPSTLERPIILKSIISFGQTSNTKQAVSFKLSKSFKRDVFSPPDSIKIEDRTK